MTVAARAGRPELPFLREVFQAQFDHAYPVHTHDAWAVMLIDDGAVKFRLDGSEHHASAAAVTVLPPGVPHDGGPADACASYRKRVLYLEADWLGAAAASAAAHNPTLRSGVLKNAVRRFHHALGQAEEMMAAEHWLLEMHRSVREALGSVGETPQDAPLARLLRDLLDERVTESVTIAAAAAELGVHPSHLVRTFSRAYGIAPHQYLVSRRVDLARRLIIGGTSIARAAVAAGFHDQAHLARHFRRFLGARPSDFAY